VARAGSPPRAGPVNDRHPTCAERPARCGCRHPAAALRGLRTAQERGYLTHWDRMVQGSQNEIARTRDSQQTSATRAGPGRGALLPPLPMSLPHGPRLMYEDKETKWRSLEF
jgi:hypothetical protein